MIALQDGQYRELAALAERIAGLFLPESRRNFVASRLQRRLRHHGLLDFGPYLTLVRGPDPVGEAERRALISALTTNVTEVFREPHHFVLLAAHLASWSRQARNADGRFAIWSAGCASGEEPLSIAATCRAVLGTRWSTRVQILASDVDEAILDRARHRTDLSSLAARLSAMPVGIPRPGWIAARADGLLADLGGGIRYLCHNVLDPFPEPGQFQAIFCRNVTIYFGPAAQRAAHARLRARLACGGMLALGHSERLLGAAPDITSFGRTAYRRTGTAWTAAREEARSCP